MEQKSNVQYRAEKEYKNSREKFYLLLREILSNAIQAVLIRKKKEKDAGIAYSPEIKLTRTTQDNKCTIDLEDNGEGFTEINTKCFDELDKKNVEKDSFNFHPLGQGRLAILYFTDKAKYETVFKDSNGTLKKKSFPYPKEEEGLFSVSDFTEIPVNGTDTYTKLIVEIDKQNTLSRAKTFYKKYGSVDDIKRWLVGTFFPYIVANEDLTIKIELNGEADAINRKSIESETTNIPFKMFIEGEAKEKSFTLWLIKGKEALRGENPIVCFARNLRAELETGSLRYTLDNNDGYLLYLTSDYFDEHVDTKGERIEIAEEVVAAINEKISKQLDVVFKETIKSNQKATTVNIRNFKKKYPSLETFIPKDDLEGGKTVVDEDALVKVAIDTKGKFEKRFWSKMSQPYTRSSKGEDIPYDESEECQKLLNSSLHIYVKHRERVLERLFQMIKAYNEDGDLKPELESDVQDLLFKRGTLIDTSDNTNHLHNLWILDDKFTTFSSSLKGKSTKPGQEQSDIYIWADDPLSVKQVLILELKSTTYAHNAGNKNEGMIAQVKRYAADVYNKPQKILNWDHDMSNVQYQGVILARKADINKELTSNNVGGGFRRIPFLIDSYYKEDEFFPTGKPEEREPIRIELYSFEDVYKLASSRNEVFFRLLKNEFEVNDATE